MTIEERAKAIADRSSAETQAEKEYYYAGYVLGATEQQKIDDDLFREVKKMVIDKAWEWLEDELDHYDLDGVSFVERFKKAMED